MNIKQWLLAQKKINVLAVTDIIYDNKLLNHPKFIKKLCDSLTLNKILDLSEKLCPSFVQQAIVNDDHDLLLAELFSVDCDYSFQN